ncbi:MAG: hypothetical protein ACFFCO_01555 [Promethearchaeota archaeon]
MARPKPKYMDVMVEISKSVRFCPAFVEGGDCEFSGPGPFITVLVTLQKIGNTGLGYQIFMDAIELGHDLTLFQGHSEVQSVYSIEKDHPGYLIALIMSDTSSGARVLDIDQRMNRVLPSYGNLAKEFIIEGDSPGQDQPWVQVVFNPVKLRIVERPETFLKRTSDST